jgi:hypothetical protein
MLTYALYLGLAFFLFFARVRSKGFDGGVVATPSTAPTSRANIAAQDAMVDHGVGVIMDALKRNKMEEDTLVVYLSGSRPAVRPTRMVDGSPDSQDEL